MRLIELRKEKKVNQQTVADFLGITRQAYSHYELGRREPDSKTIRALAKYFDVLPDYLTGYSNIKKHAIPYASFNQYSTLENDALDFGPQILKREREHLGLTAKEAGEEAGLTESDILGIEEGSIPLDLELAQKIAECYFSDVSQLLFDYDCYYGTVPEEYHDMVSKYERLTEQTEEEAREDFYRSLHEDKEVGKCDVSQLTLTQPNYGGIAQNREKSHTQSGEEDLQRQKLLHNYDILNSDGRDKLIDYSDDLIFNPKYTTAQSEQNNRNIPYSLLPASAGLGEWLDMNSFEELSIPDIPEYAAADFALRVHGDSMTPDYNDGDIVLVHSQDAINDGDIGVFWVEGEGGFIKELRKGSLYPHNKEYSPIALRSKDYRCFGKVIAKLNK